MSSPLISVIVPCFNVESYVGDCIRSVLAQEYSNLEILCINDKSTDATPEVLRAFLNDKRVKLIEHQCNKGLGAARNTGIEQARGEFLFFLDSDDLITEKSLQSLLDLAITTGADITSGQLQTFDEKGSAPVSYFLKGVNGIYSYKSNRQIILGKAHIVAWGRLYRTNFFKDVIGSFPEGVWYEDTFPFFKGQCGASILAVCDTVCVLWRQRAGSISKLKVNTHDISTYQAQVYTTLYEHDANRGRRDFLNFAANSFAWYQDSEELRKAYREMLAKFEYSQAEIARSTGLKRLRKIQGKPYTMFDRIRRAINRLI
ncbi:MAG: glycosyltransferase [Shewanella sp.]|nr:glycosyltransferase [Shewanella sp.]